MPSIKIPTKPHVDQYLRNFFGPDMNVTEETDLGQFFLLRLDNRTDPKGARLSDMKRYTCITKLNISLDLFMRYGGTMTSSNAAKFHQYVERVIKDRLGIYCYAKIEEGIKMQRALQMFYRNYRFTEELWPMETARTELKRFIERLQKKRTRLGTLYF